MKLKLLKSIFASSLLCSFGALNAADWAYDAANLENNTKDSLELTNTSYSIDTSEGELTILGGIKMASSPVTVTGAYALNVNGQINNTFNSLTLDNANLNAAGGLSFLYNSTSLTSVGTSKLTLSSQKAVFNASSNLVVKEGSNLTVTGNNLEFNNSNITLENNAVLNADKVDIFFNTNITLGDNAILNANAVSVMYGGTKNISLGKNSKLIHSGTGRMENISSLTMQEGSSIYMGGYAHLSGSVTLNNLGANAVSSGIELYGDEGLVIDISLGNNSLECLDASSAMIKTTYAKTMLGEINISLDDFILSEDFIKGETYTIALIYAQNALPEDWLNSITNIENSTFAEYVEGSLTQDGNLISLQIQAVPEPSSYAAILAAAAFALAALRRRKI